MNNLIIKSLITFVILNSAFVIGYSQTWKEMVDSCSFYQETGDYQTALIWAQKALPIAEKEFGQNDTNFVTTVGTISELYYYLGKRDSAIYYGDFRLSICRRIFKEDHPKLAEGISNMAFFFHVSGDYTKAEPLYIEGLEMCRRLFKGDHPDLATGINNMAKFYYGRGDYNQAEPLYIEALEISRRLFKGDHPDLAIGIDNMAMFYVGRGDYKQAETLYIEALEMRRRIFKSDNDDLAISINNMALFYQERGDYSKAEPLLKEALGMNRRLFKIDTPLLANSINSIALFYNNRGDYKQAEPFYKEALAMYRRLFKTDNPRLANIINNMAVFYNERGDFNQAEPLYKEALDMYRRLFETDNPYLAGSINSMAFFYNSKCDYQQAEPLFKEALNMYRRIFINDNNELGISINNMAFFYNERGDYKQAEPLLKEALDMYRRLFQTDNTYLAGSINNMANFYNYKGDYIKAEQFYYEALNVYKNMLNNYLPSLSENEKKFFWKTVSNKFETFNTFGVKRYSENPLITCNMYDMQLYSKALLFNSTSKIKKRIMNSNDLDLIDKYKEFTDKKELLVKLYTMTEDARKKKGFSVDSIEKITNEIEKELSLKSELYAQSYDKKKVTWKSIQTLLKPDEAAVEVMRFRYNDSKRFADTIYYAFLIVTEATEEHPDIVILKNGKELENEYYNDYRMKITAKIEDKLSYGRYWEKLHDKLKDYKKIYFSADGIYNKLNPATLLMPNGKYLLDEQDIQQVNSTKDILLGFYQTKQESNIYNSALLIGNPNFSLSESLVNESSEKIRNQVKEYNDQEQEINIEKIASTRGIMLGRLPGTEKEIIDIEKLLKEKNWLVESYLGDMALKTVIKIANNPKILHIATHGMFLEDVNLENEETFGFETKKVVDNPLLRSGLFFTGANNYIKSDSTKPAGDENGLLTAYEAMNLDLDKTDLVVLSACETGLGEVKNGEGVYGLRRAFQQAGAKTVIMSLWAVNDDATQKLMSSFYSNWVTGKTKREAFSNAQQEVRKQFPEPYFWGAFVMVGE